MNLVAGVEIEVFGVTGSFLAADYNQDGEIVVSVRVTLGNRNLIEAKAAPRGTCVIRLSETILQVPGAVVVPRFCGAGAGDAAMLEGVAASLSRIQRELAFRSKLSA